MLGLDINVYGLEFYDLGVERKFDGDTPVLRITGEVRNIGRDTKLVPPVRISLRDTRSQDILEVMKAVSDQDLEAGDALPFCIEATFAPLGDATPSRGKRTRIPKRAGIPNAVSNQHVRRRVADRQGFPKLKNVMFIRASVSGRRIYPALYPTSQA